MTYERSARFYDAVYAGSKDYRKESQRVQELIESNRRDHPATTLLDVACGTGLHDQYLSRWFQLEGLDLDPAMLAIARTRLPEITFYQGDMTNFDLGIDHRYDVVTCLFSAIGHITTLEGLHRAVATMAHHLTLGGVLLIEPWLTPDNWKPNHFSLDAVDEPDFKLARLTRSRREGRITHLEMRHYIVSANGFESITEHHELALYAIEEYLGAMRAAGLGSWFEPTGISSNGRGILIGRNS